MRYNSEVQLNLSNKIVCPWKNNLGHETKFCNYSCKSLWIDNDGCKPRNHKYVCPKLEAGKWQNLMAR